MDGFHFLGANFQVSRNIWQKNQAVTITMHDRSCRRALDKVQTMTQDAVNPATRQRYLMQWAAWWALALSQKESLYTYINHWIKFCLGQNTVPRDITLLGLGLLIKQKNRMFPEIKKPIVSAEVREQGGQYTIFAASVRDELGNQ